MSASCRNQARDSSVVPGTAGSGFDTVSSWERALARALAERGEADADTLAAVGVAIFSAAVAAWMRSGGSLTERVQAGFRAVR
jgi:TetR/AcrR family transcriptional regulator, regulator of mycofactocin system